MMAMDGKFGIFRGQGSDEARDLLLPNRLYY